MALFPAFAEVSSEPNKDSFKEPEWLKNKSFRTSDALDLHNRLLSKSQEAPSETESSLSKDDEENDAPVKKKKKRADKKKKKKKHKKKSSKHSDSSESDSEIVFPSDLKRVQEADSSKTAKIGNSFSWLDDLPFPTARPFCVDNKPDPANWTYKCLYRGDVARYKRKGNSSLGVDPRKQEVSWEDSESTKKQKSKQKRKLEGRYFSSASRQLLKDENPVATLPKTPSSNVLSDVTFIPVEEDWDEKKKEAGTILQPSSTNPLGVYDSSTALWLQGKGKEEQKEEGLEVEPSQVPVPAVNRTEEFNRQLREQPSDTELWIKYIHYQDEISEALFGDNEDQQGKDMSERRKSSYRAVLEKKLSIAERAVATNPGSVSLQRERLKICQELYDPSALAKEWKKLVFLHPNSGALLKEYLLFTQSYFSNFSVSKVNSAYGKCLSMLSAVRDGSMVSHPALPGTDEDILDIFTQQCHFLRQCGHLEKAVSLFQAMMDFTFFKPDSVKDLKTKQQIEFFEPFWDSGEERVGEFGAKGWRAWMQQQERGGWIQPSAEDEEDEEEEEEEEVKDRSLPRWKVWLDLESTREAAQWLPWRPDKAKGQSEEDCEDPDRQVLFDDIGPSLICLSSPELQLRFLQHFLSFLGLPVESAVSAHLCQTGLLLEDLSLFTQGSDPKCPLTYQHNQVPVVNSVGHMTTLQGTRKLVGLGRQGERFLSNVVNMIQPVLSAQQQAVLSLSLMQYEKQKVLRCLTSNKRFLRSQGKRSKRVAKRLLKEPANRSCLRLWQEYGHLEWILGNKDEARKVFSTASEITGNKGLNVPDLLELCLLWAQLEVEDAGSGPVDLALSPAVSILAKVTEGASPSPAALSPVSILKARKLYEQTLTASLSALDSDPGAGEKDQMDVQGKPPRLRGLVGCYALFQYLTVGIQAANSIYAQARERVERRRSLLSGASSSVSGDSFSDRLCIISLESECEHLAVQQASLLQHHNTVSVSPLATLRETLTLSLSSWPNNAPLWSLYLQLENRYHSAGRARRFFHSITQGNSRVVPRLFAIVAEQQRKQLVDACQRSCRVDAALTVIPENGLSNRIRGLFERAVATDVGGRCPLVWRMYMYFLVSEGKLEKARGLFYKALQNIPWAKGLYMDAALLFPEHLQEFVDLMTEKEIRLRLPLEELDILLED
ncbi:nuclear exosome regulator NRDE2 [Neosynchiropus ocellatus]